MYIYLADWEGQTVQPSMDVCKVIVQLHYYYYIIIIIINLTQKSHESIINLTLKSNSDLIHKRASETGSN